MIKNILLTVILQEKSMNYIFGMKKKFFTVSFGITNIIFPILFNIFLCITQKRYSCSEYCKISILEIKNNIIFNLLLFSILGILFYIHSKNKSYFTLIFKTIIAMNFIHPIMTVINFYVGNLLFEIAFLVYDFFFIKLFIKMHNQDVTITEKKQFAIIISTFIILLIVYGFIYKILLLN